MKNLFPSANSSTFLIKKVKRTTSARQDCVMHIRYLNRVAPQTVYRIKPYFIHFGQTFILMTSTRRKL